MGKNDFDDSRSKEIEQAKEAKNTLYIHWPL